MYRSDLQNTLEKLCPHSLAEFEYNGFLSQSYRKDIKKLAFSLGLSKKSVLEAIRRRADCLVIHNSPENLDTATDAYFSGIKRLIRESDMFVYRLHLPLDFAKGGIIEQLCRIMKFNASPATLVYDRQKIVGGVYLANEKIFLNDVIKRVRLLNPRTIRLVKGRKKQVNTIAIASGDGCKPEFLLQLKPDIFICGLLNQESVRIANDLGITLIEATSYATESEPMKRFVIDSRQYFPNVDIEFIDIKNDVEMI